MAGAADDAAIDPNELSEDALLSELGLDAADDNDITNLKHVKPRAYAQAEEVATRSVCADFSRFKSVF